jgi:hypothetical protein
MHKAFGLVVWTVPLALYSADALAWGLYTHVYFAQLLICSTPLADPRFRKAIQRFPELLLAGACLPDAALFNRFTSAPGLRSSHQWRIARRMLAEGTDDESRALAVGYASHLLADVIAHNYFVPEHEGRWFDCPVVTHAASEWAMDQHVAPQLRATPGALLAQHRGCLARQAARYLRCTERAAAGALWWLGHGERLLRGSGIPRTVRLCARGCDAAMARRFDHYISETSRCLAQIDRMIAGESPPWRAEPNRPHAVAIAPDETGAGTPLPRDLFEQVASRAS